MTLLSGFKPDPEMLPRVRQMLLLEFTLDEMLAPLEQALSGPVSLVDVRKHVTYLQDIWRELPQAEQVSEDHGRADARARMMLRELLTVYQDMLANHKAGVEGLFSHADGRPVLPVKALEVASMVEKIVKLENELVDRRKRQLTQFGGGPAATYQPPVFEEDPSEMDEVIEIDVTDLHP